MRTRLFAAAAGLTFAILAGSAHAQGIAVGIKGGYSSSNVDVSGAVDTEARNTYHLGAYARMRFPGPLGVQGEVLYSGQGYGLSATGLIEVNRVNYVNIPVMLQYDVLGLANVHAGPQLSFLLKAETEVTQLGITQVLDIGDNIQSREYGFVFGAAVSLPMKLELNARYVMGLSDINDLSSVSEEFRNRVLQISLHRKLFGIGE